MADSGISRKIFATPKRYFPQNSQQFSHDINGACPCYLVLEKANRKFPNTTAEEWLEKLTLVSNRSVWHKVDDDTSVEPIDSRSLLETDSES